MKKLDEGKWALKPFLGMYPSLPWCAPTPTLVNKEGKQNRIWNQEKEVLKILVSFQQHKLTQMD